MTVASNASAEYRFKLPRVFSDLEHIQILPLGKGLIQAEEFCGPLALCAGMLDHVIIFHMQVGAEPESWLELPHDFAQVS